MQLKRDTWHVTCDMWHMTYKGWWAVSQNFRSLPIQLGSEGVLKILNKRMTNSMYHGDACKTATATPGLLIIYFSEQLWTINYRTISFSMHTGTIKEPQTLPTYQKWVNTNYVGLPQTNSNFIHIFCTFNIHGAITLFIHLFEKIMFKLLQCS